MASLDFHPEIIAAIEQLLIGYNRSKGIDCYPYVRFALCCLISGLSK
jgi:hypothetical protein